VLSRRWAIFAISVALAAWGAWALGQWQFHRLQERRVSNHRTVVNLESLPVPVDTLMTTRHEPDNDYQWRRVTVHGQYDDAHSIVLKYQTRDSAAGVDVITPLRMANGDAVLVDRGWMATENSGNIRPNLPPATTGQVTVTGYVRRNAGGSATNIGDMSTRAISSDSIGKVVDYPLYGGFLDIQTQSPAPQTVLHGTELPDDTSDGPHFFYGLQWWFFGIMAVFGFFYLMYDERKRMREEREKASVPQPQQTLPLP
jgi:cytochrome oxidase assembly protein ShyY1